MLIFNSLGDYLQNCQSYEARVLALETLVDQLILAAANAATTGQYQEYWLDDGQSKTRIIYRNMNEIDRSILSTQKLIAYYKNQLQGRITRLMPGQNFNGHGRC